MLLAVERALDAPPGLLEIVRVGERRSDVQGVEARLVEPFTCELERSEHGVAAAEDRDAVLLVGLADDEAGFFAALSSALHVQLVQRL